MLSRQGHSLQRGAAAASCDRSGDVRFSKDLKLPGNYPDIPKSFLSRRPDVRNVEATIENMGQNSSETDTFDILLLRFSDSQEEDVLRRLFSKEVPAGTSAS